MSGYGAAPSRGVDVLIGEGVLNGAGDTLRERLGGRKLLLVTDAASYRLFAGMLTTSLNGAGYTVSPFVMPQGAEQRHPAILAALWERMAEAALTRGDIVLAAGGGTAGDAAVCAAATYLGGIGCALAPTTLLWQLDGGLRGAFTMCLPGVGGALRFHHMPRLLIMDTQTLALLPRERLQEGIAEALRSAALLDGALFETLEHATDESIAAHAEQLVESVLSVKRQALGMDGRDDATGALSCGMFIADALLAATYQSLPYGRALSIALCMMTRYTEAVGLTEQGVYARLSAAMSAHGLPTSPPRFSRDIFRSAVAVNVRSGAARIRESYIKDIGRIGIMEFKLADIDSLI